MPKRKREESQITPGTSLDADDEDDEDFVVSHSEGSSNASLSSTDSDSDSESASDDEDKPAATHSAQGLPAGLQEAFRQALENEDKVVDEEIFSDSEISDVFSEEEDDPEKVLAGSDSEGEEGEISHLDRSQQVAEPSITALTGLSTLRSSAASPQPHPTPVSAPPIAQRTRAHVSYIDIPIEELEAKLANHATNEPFLLNIDDNEEYERFLEQLKRSGIGAGLDSTQNQTGSFTAGSLFGDTDKEDSDDEDFMAEIARMMGEDPLEGIPNQGDWLAAYPGLASPGGTWRLAGRYAGLEEEESEDEEAGAIKRVNKRRRTSYNRRTTQLFKRRTTKPPKPPRRSARLMKKNAARPLYAKRLMERRAHKLETATEVALNAAKQGDGVAASAAAATAVAQTLRLDELASIAAEMNAGDGSTHVTAAIRHQYAAVAHQRPVSLPSDSFESIRQQANTVVWRPPLPKAMRKLESSITVEDMEKATITGADVDRLQYGHLYYLIHQHVQLLLQVHVMSIATSDTDSAAATATMLHEFQALSLSQTALRQAFGYPPYLPGCLGIEAADGNADVWTPKNPGEVYTVADVALLRVVPQVLDDLEKIKPEQQDTKALTNGSIEPESNGDRSRDGKVDLLQQQSVPGTSSAPKQRYKKKPKKTKFKEGTPHHIWTNLSVAIETTIAPALPYFDMLLLPSAPQFRYNFIQANFTPGEDDLLAWGMRKYGYDWEKVRTTLLPTKTSKQLGNRKKNKAFGNTPDNPIKSVNNIINAPLTPAEEALIMQALDYYGKQPQRWQMICRDYLPHRIPHVLATMWGKKDKDMQHRIRNGFFNLQANSVGAYEDPAEALGPLQHQPHVEADVHRPPATAMILSPTRIIGPNGVENAALTSEQEQLMQAQLMAAMSNAAAMSALIWHGGAHPNGPIMPPAHVPMEIAGSDPTSAGAFTMSMPSPARPASNFQQGLLPNDAENAMTLAAQGGQPIVSTLPMMSPMMPIPMPGWPSIISPAHVAAAMNALPYNAGAFMSPNVLPSARVTYNDVRPSSPRALQGRVEREDRPEPQPRMIFSAPVADAQEKQWSATEDKIVLKAALNNGGELTEAQVQEFAQQLRCEQGAVVGRVQLLVDRFRSMAKAKAQGGAT